MLKIMLIFYGVRIRLLLMYALSSILKLLGTCKFWGLLFLLDGVKGDSQVKTT